MEKSHKSTSSDASRTHNATIHYHENSRTLHGRHAQNRLSLPQQTVADQSRLPTARKSMADLRSSSVRDSDVSSPSPPGSQSPKGRLSGYSTVTRAKAPVLQTELRAMRYKQSHASEPTSPLKSPLRKQTMKPKSLPSCDKATIGASPLEDLFWSPTESNTKVTIIKVPEPAEPGDLGYPGTTKQDSNNGAVSPVSSTETAVELVDTELVGVEPTKDPAETDVWQQVSVVEKSTAARVVSSSQKPPGLHIVTDVLIASNKGQQYDHGADSAKESAIESADKQETPVSAASEATTADSSILIITGSGPTIKDIQALQHLSKVADTPSSHDRKGSGSQRTPLRANASEFVPQGFSPPTECWSNPSVGSPLQPVTNESPLSVRALNIDIPPMHQQLDGFPIPPLRSTIAAPQTYQRPMTTLPLGMTSPYRYVQSGIPSHGIMDPVRAAGIQRTNWRERNPVPCDVLSIDQNTLQPVGYPGHTPLEWREISLAIADYNRKRSISPIPFGVDARGRFYQPGKNATSVRADAAAKAAEEMATACLCRNLDAHSHQQRMLIASSGNERIIRCVHCGSRSHPVSECDQPPKFDPRTPQHVTLQSYLHTAHWKQRHIAKQINYRELLNASPHLKSNFVAPFTCTICPQRHSNDEVAQVIEYIVAQMRANGEEPGFDWQGFWVADFSQCPTLWALKPVDDATKLFLAFNPLGNVAIQELVDTAGEALRVSEVDENDYGSKTEQRKTVLVH